MSFTVRPVTSTDAPALASLINPIIRAGNTTALEAEFTAGALDAVYLTGPKVHCCHVAIDETGEVAAFQTLGRYPGLPDDVGDIGTFAALDRKQSGAGSALFAATTARARDLGHSAINATIRADNVGGLAFYAKLGFADHGVTPAMPLADGTPVDRVHKRYSLISRET
ncbi:GNAT family N-acetyltransferase [Novosphingobium sp.]|uniref:GNAT family N-acetyltransferase n=1 Tax=Novosphingobium sp. TaxID=1874826 RepID=UPI00286D1641|nr:GNAT family N-acetyltransferase [Novosphingobium sp.]